MNIETGMAGTEEQCATIVDLEAAREHRRFLRYRQRAENVLAENRSALEKLFLSGVVFTRHGSKVARDLLQAHQTLLRVVDISSREAGAGLDEHELHTTERMFEEIEALLDKASGIARRNRSLFQTSSSPVF